MSYKYELHCHTSDVSRCASTSAADAVKLYADAGYDGIVITDHYSPQTFVGAEAFVPQNYVEKYTRGYKNALDAAPEGFTVLLGMELRYFFTANDYLAYGVTEQFLRDNGNLMALYPRRFYKLAHENGLLVVQAHPFRGYIYRANPKYLDGCEVCNGKDSKEENDKAMKWFGDNNMEIMTGGSDFHHATNRALSGIITERRIETNDDLLEVLRNREFELIKNE